MKKKLLTLGLTLSPLAALAQVTGGTPSVCGSGSIQTVQDVICKLNEILGAILPFLVAVGVILFVWGVLQYVIGGDEEAKKKGRTKMIYGIIGLAVIIALWGLVKILTNTFGLRNVQNIEYPTVPY
ncbi:MAG: pilin [Patescibacteria group bacterium]